MANAAALPLSVVSCCASPTRDANKPRFGHLAQVVRKDIKFFQRGIEWVKTTHLSSFSKTFEDVLWFKNFEDPSYDPGEPPSWPNPTYPGLSGVDLLMADLKALKDYAYYLQHVSKIWSMPLPEHYDPEKVVDYFSCRPHVLALRVFEVLSSFAFAAIKVRTSGIFKLNRFDVDKDDTRNSSDYYIGQLLKETMLNLGPTFVKVGQSLSTRPDIIGSEISKALSELHDQIPPFPRPLAVEIIEEELGCPVETVFSYISKEPVAAASFGQVYQGHTIDGCIVAVKVQRPNLRHAVVRDVYILRLGLGLLQKIAKRKNDLRLYADELGKGFVGELDYTLEAANASQFMEAHAPFKFISVPKVFKHLSRKRVLTMEWMVGENPTELLSLSQGLNLHGVDYSERQQLDAKKHLLDLVNKGVEASLVQLLETGLLHADPHPGNLRYTPAGQIGFLDFGLLCRMEKKHQLAMLGSIVHIVNGDWAALVLDLIEMDVVKPGPNVRRVAMDLEDALGEVVFKDGIPDIKFSRVLGKIWSIALKYHLRMPPYYTLVLRSLASLEGLAIAADKDFKTFQAAYPYVVRKLLTDNSAAMRRILHSVVFNKQKEFQWQNLTLFLRVGATRKGMHRFMVLDTDTRPEYVTHGKNGVFEVANLVLRLLPSKDGAVLRRLLMTADAASLVRAMVSKEAVYFRKHVSKALADVLYQWMSETLGMANTMIQYDSSTRVANVQFDEDTESSTPFYRIVLRDRRLKVVFSKVLKDIMKQPILALRFYWASFVIFVSALAVASHQFLISWSERYITSVSFSLWRFAVPVSV